MPIAGIGSSAAVDSVALLVATLQSVAPGSDTVLKRGAINFEFVFTSITSSDTGSGLPTAGAIRWPDGVTGAFSGAVIDSTYGIYSGYAVTYVGATTKTVTVSGTSFDSNGNPYGTTAAVT